MASRVDDDGDVVGGVAEGVAEDVVDGVEVAEAGVAAVGGVAANGPVSCGADDGDTAGIPPPPPPPGARQSMISKAGRVFIPNAVFIGRLLKRTIGNTCAPRNMRITATCSSKFV